MIEERRPNPDGTCAAAAAAAAVLGELRKTVFKALHDLGRMCARDRERHLLPIHSHNFINLGNISNILRYLYGRTHM